MCWICIDALKASENIATGDSNIFLVVYGHSRIWVCLSRIQWLYALCNTCWISDIVLYHQFTSIVALKVHFKKVLHRNRSMWSVRLLMVPSYLQLTKLVTKCIFATLLINSRMIEDIAFWMSWASILGLLLLWIHELCTHDTCFFGDIGFETQEFSCIRKNSLNGRLGGVVSYGAHHHSRTYI